MHHGPTDSGISAIREMVLRVLGNGVLLHTLAGNTRVDIAGEHLVKRGLVFDNAGEAKPREFRRLFVKMSKSTSHRVGIAGLTGDRS
jgi:hypothetical protein